MKLKCPVLKVVIFYLGYSKTYQFGLAFKISGPGYKCARTCFNTVRIISFLVMPGKPLTFRYVKIK
jgi:hypothetical protein